MKVVSDDNGESGTHGFAQPPHGLDVAVRITLDDHGTVIVKQEADRASVLP